jgi:hypothetical protein
MKCGSPNREFFQQGIKDEKSSKDCCKSLTGKKNGMVVLQVAE